MKNIVNIINFVRAVEPRPGRNVDMLLPVAEQYKLLHRHGLRATFLLQYDTLLEPRFVSLIQDNRDVCELGVWLEVVQPLVEAAGMTWTGRYSWDWHNDCGYLIGYAPDAREKLIDIIFEQFKRLWGHYPRVVGAWHIDAHSLLYMQEKYHIIASCICREQIGMDGYTLWGGYYNQAYYPSRYNMLCPAQTMQNQINVPVFRMLGSDPLHQYDRALETINGQITLESIAKCPDGGGGGHPAWVDWFFEQNFNGCGCSFQYAQVGQENTFGWPNMKDGLTYQTALVKRLQNEGQIEVMTLGESGKWFSSTYQQTPMAAQGIFADWRGNDKSLWVNTRYYRLNIKMTGNTFFIRDLYCFDERFREHYLTDKCLTHSCEYTNLPVMDGLRWSDETQRAGVYPMEADGTPVCFTGYRYRESESSVSLSFDTQRHGTITFECLAEQVNFHIENANGMLLKPSYVKARVFGDADNERYAFGNHNCSSIKLTYLEQCRVADEHTVSFVFGGHAYGVAISGGSVDADLTIHPQTSLTIRFVRTPFDG